MATFPGNQLAKLRRRRIRYQIKRGAEIALSQIKIVIALGGLVVVILVSIPWLSGPLQKAGLSAPGTLANTIVMLVVVSTFFEVRGMSDRKAVPQRRHFPDPMDVYPVLLERAQQISRKEEKCLDVLGLTLFTAWPSIRFWLNRSDLNGWRFRFTALTGNENFLSNQVAVACFHDSRSNLDNIAQYAKSSAAQARSVTLEPFSYDFMPMLHGFRLGNGDLFYSLLYWQPDGKLCMENFSYEFVPREDHSPSADAIREIFQSWFERATQIKWRGQ